MLFFTRDIDSLCPGYEFKGLKLCCKSILAFPFLGYVSALEHSLSLLPMTGLVKGFVVFSGKEDVLMKKKNGFSNPALKPVRSLQLVFCAT